MVYRSTCLLFLPTPIHLLESDKIALRTVHSYGVFPLFKVFSGSIFLQIKPNSNFSSVYSIFHQIYMGYWLAKHWGVKGELERQIPCLWRSQSFQLERKPISSSSLPFAPIQAFGISQMKPGSQDTSYMPAHAGVFSHTVRNQSLSDLICQVNSVPITFLFPPSACQSKIWISQFSLKWLTRSFQNHVFPSISLPSSIKSIPRYYQMSL